jgi:hypothetical protein
LWFGGELKHGGAASSSQQSAVSQGRGSGWKRTAPGEKWRPSPAWWRNGVVKVLVVLFLIETAILDAIVRFLE